MAFYVDVFGWNHQTGEGLSGPYTAISVGDRVVAGAMPKPRAEIPNSWSVYFAVDDTARAIDTTRAAGGRVDFGPLQLPDVGIFAGLVDPTGAHFSVIQLAGEVD